MDTKNTQKIVKYEDAVETERREDQREEQKEDLRRMKARRYTRMSKDNDDREE